MRRLRDVGLVQVALSMVVGGLVGLLILGGAIAYFLPSNEPSVVPLLSYLVFASLYGGLLFLCLLAIRSVVREWGRASQQPSPSARDLNRS